MNVEGFLETLPMMAKGLLSIFAVMAAIGVMIVLLNRATSGKREEKK